jgi:hypothetical protein
MTFLDPWIDPRVVQVRSAAAQAYLRQRGWKPLPGEQPNLLRYEGLPGGGDSPMVQVPLQEHGGDYPQRVIELIADLALAEKRFAGEVLDDILRQPRADLPAPVPGKSPFPPPEPG